MLEKSQSLFISPFAIHKYTWMSFIYIDIGGGGGGDGTNLKPVWALSTAKSQERLHTCLKQAEWRNFVFFLKIYIML